MDAYEELGLAPELLLDEDKLQERFDELCRRHHPDKGGDPEKFARLKASFEELRDPGQRLRGWILRQGGRVDGVTAAAPGELFGRVGDLLARADGVRGRKEQARSSLARALAEKEALGLLREVEDLRTELGELRRGIVEQFAGFQERGGAEALPEAEAAAVRWAFLDRWDRQLQERWISLGM